MELKNELKNEALQNLWVRLLTYNSCFPKSFINLFKECEEEIEGEIAAIKAELTDANRRKDIYHGSADHLRNMVLEKGDELRKANNKISDLEEQLAQAKQRLTLLETSRAGWRSRAQHAEKRVMDLNKKIHELEAENANLRVTQFDANAIKFGDFVTVSWSDDLYMYIEEQGSIVVLYDMTSKNLAYMGVNDQLTKVGETFFRPVD